MALVLDKVQYQGRGCTNPFVNTGVVLGEPWIPSFLAPSPLSVGLLCEVWGSRAAQRSRGAIRNTRLSTPHPHPPCCPAWISCMNYTCAPPPPPLCKQIMPVWFISLHFQRHSDWNTTLCFFIFLSPFFAVWSKLQRQPRSAAFSEQFAHSKHNN